MTCSTSWGKHAIEELFTITITLNKFTTTLVITHSVCLKYVANLLLILIYFYTFFYDLRMKGEYDMMISLSFYHKMMDPLPNTAPGCYHSHVFLKTLLEIQTLCETIKIVLAYIILWHKLYVHTGCRAAILPIAALQPVCTFWLS